MHTDNHTDKWEVEEQVCRMSYNKNQLCWACFHPQLHRVRNTRVGNTMWALQPLHQTGQITHITSSNSEQGWGSNQLTIFCSKEFRRLIIYLWNIPPCPANLSSANWIFSLLVTAEWSSPCTSKFTQNLEIHWRSSLSTHSSLHAVLNSICKLKLLQLSS